MQCFFWKQKSGGTSAAGARRAPQARVERASRGAEGAEGGCGEGRGYPLPTGEGAVGIPSPEKFLFLELKMASFRAFLLLFL